MTLGEWLLSYCYIRIYWKCSDSEFWKKTHWFLFGKACDKVIKKYSSKYATEHCMLLNKQLLFLSLLFCQCFQVY